MVWTLLNPIVLDLHVGSRTRAQRGGPFLSRISVLRPAVLECVQRIADHGGRFDRQRPQCVVSAGLSPISDSGGSRDDGADPVPLVLVHPGGPALLLSDAVWVAGHCAAASVRNPGAPDTGVRLPAGALSVSFHDTKHLLSVGLRFLFFLTPILYATESFPPVFHAFYAANPLTHLIRAYRAILMDAAWPNWSALCGVAAASLIVLIFGHRFFESRRFRFIEDIE